MRSPLVEFVWSVVITLTLVALGLFYLVRELIDRRRNEAYIRLPPEDRRHFQAQFVRRTIGSTLLVLAGVAIFIGQGVLDWRESPRIYAWLWTGVILGLFGIVCLAGADLMAIRRYARRHQKRIETDRRAMIERQLEIYRAERDAERHSPPDLDVQRN